MRKCLIVVLSTLLIGLYCSAQGVTLRKIGKDNLLFNILGAYPMNGMLYYVDYNGTINKVSLDSGASNRLANTSYKRANQIFGWNGKLYIRESDGSMNEVNPMTGAWQLISGLTVWSKIEQIAVVRNTLYSVENGALYRHRGINVDDRTQIGESQFYNVGFLIDRGFSLYSLFNDGSFYEINTTDGGWRKILKGKLLKGAVNGDILGDKFYVVNIGGDFGEVVLADGTNKVLDNTQFKKARFLFSEGSKLYVVMTDGNLYEVILG